MTIYRGFRSGKKPSGARYWPARKKRSTELSKDTVHVKLSDALKRMKKRVRGGNKHTRIITATHANVSDGKKIKRVKIKTVIENKANRQYVRQNVITKGAIVDTEIGKARVTSKPTVHGVVNAVLVR